MLGKLADLCRKNGLVNTVAQYTYLNLLPSLLPASRPGGREGTSLSGPRGPRVAFICDEMTWLDFKDQCRSIFLSPMDWREQMDDFAPEL